MRHGVVGDGVAAPDPFLAAAGGGAGAGAGGGRRPPWPSGTSVTADPEEALRLVEEERPHLVLLDLVLPGANGMELMKDIAAADVPVIFLAAHGQEQLVARALGEGATDYLVKPFSPAELAARIRAALRWRETSL